MSNTSAKTKVPNGLYDLVTVIAEANSLDEVFAAVANLANTHIGHKLFTIMAFDAKTMRVQRLYSSNSEAYPPTGIKEKRNTAWGRQVLEQGNPYIGHNAKNIRTNFDDHEIISGLGLESVLNVPIRIGGQTIGTMNLLNSAEHYNTSDLEWGRILSAQLVGPLCSGILGEGK